jgi:lipopolysaccharide/colanic/teichoic acid biosynthesis glycosyltransferase
MQSVDGRQDREPALSSFPSSVPWNLVPLSARSAEASLDGEPALELRPDSPSTSKWSVSPAKRCFDAGVALVVLISLALPMMAVAILIRLFSQEPALFVQQRVGRGGKLFSIYKFRSMGSSAGQAPGPGLTQDGDSRITPLGRILRKFKIDELPQFYNVLRGDMSLIGPRPTLPQYAAILNMPFRPGITGAATLAFRREEEVLRHIHPALLDAFYDRHIRPMKAILDVDYMAHATLLSDMRIVAETLRACIMPATDRELSVAREGSEQRNLDPQTFSYPNKDQTLEEI